MDDDFEGGLHEQDDYQAPSVHLFDELDHVFASLGASSR
jgi:hypothetical protein